MFFIDAVTKEDVEVISGIDTNLVFIRKSDSVTALSNFYISFDEETMVISGYKNLPNSWHKFELFSIGLKLKRGCL